MKKNEKNIAKYLLEVLMEIVELFAYGVLSVSYTHLTLPTTPYV